MKSKHEMSTLPRSGTKGVLQDRIDAGQADPISDEEREIVASLRAGFQRKYRLKRTTFGSRAQVKRLGASA